MAGDAGCALARVRCCGITHRGRHRSRRPLSQLRMQPSAPLEGSLVSLGVDFFAMRAAAVYAMKKLKRSGVIHVHVLQLCGARRGKRAAARP